MSRVLALDIGTVRIGAAISDPTRTIAQGLGVWDAESWREDFGEALRKYTPEVVVLGLPVRTDGKHSDAADRVRVIAGELEAEYPDLRVETQDERFTTVIAQRAMLEADLSRRKRRKSVDKIAAVVILEDWLESHRQL
ncbi:MAG: Holliday junction resolvase RuvX [Synergistaceae bacterium]|nr:Holliday junction resolvase RuvX [Synergistaceae bacterium]